MTLLRKPTVAESLAAEHRAMRLTVTAGHTLDFLGGGYRAPVSVPVDREHEAPLRFATLSSAYTVLRTAEGATAALMASLNGAGCLSDRRAA